MGGQNNPSPASSSMAALRRPNTNFHMDDDHKLLFFMLKTLELSKVRWEQVGDYLGVRGHTARMRYVRYKDRAELLLEGEPAARKNKKDNCKDGKGDKGKSFTSAQKGTKRCLDAMDWEDDDGSKRIKMEHGMTPPFADYGYGPPPPYYPGPAAYGMPPSQQAFHHSPPGQLPQGYYPADPHRSVGQSAPRMPSQSTYPPRAFHYTSNRLTTADESTRPAFSNKTTTTVKPEPHIKREQSFVGAINAEQNSTKIKSEPHSGASTKPALRLSQTPRDTSIKTEENVETSKRSSTPAPTSIDLTEWSSTPPFSADASLNDTRKCSEVVTLQDAPMLKIEAEQPAPAAMEIEEVNAKSSIKDSMAENSLSAIAEVSQEEFAKAVDAEAAALAQPISMAVTKAISSHVREPSPASPEIPHASIQAHLVNQSPAPAAAAVSVHASETTSDIIAHVASQSSDPKVWTAAPATNPSAALSVRGSPTSAAPALYPPSPTPNRSLQNYGPAETYMSPLGYPHFRHVPPYPRTPRADYAAPPSYWHGISHINKPSPNAAVHNTYAVLGWSPHPHPRPAPDAIPSRGSSFGDISTPINPPPSTSPSMMPQDHTSRDVQVPAFDEFDLTNFDFGLGMEIGDMVMEPQFVMSGADARIGEYETEE